MKNYRIQFWRIIFTYIIALYHLNNSYGRNTSWYIAVEFFFILSGYLLVKKFEQLEEKGKELSAWSYTGQKYLNFLPHHLAAFVPAFLVYIWAENLGLAQAAWAAVRHVWVVFLVQTVGISVQPPFAVQTQTWYLSVLLFMGALIWYLLKNHKRLFTEIITPFSVMIIYAYLYRNYANVNEHQEVLGVFLNTAWLRGFSAMNCGVIAYYGAKRIRNSTCSMKIRQLFGGVSFLGFASVIVASAYCWRTVYDFFFIPVLTVSCMFAFCTDGTGKIFHNAVIDRLGSLTLAIYLNHKMFRTIFKQYFTVLDWNIYLFYIVLITAFSAFMYILVNKIIRVIKIKWGQEA